MCMLSGWRQFLTQKQCIFLSALGWSVVASMIEGARLGLWRWSIVAKSIFYQTMCIIIPWRIYWQCPHLFVLIKQLSFLSLFFVHLGLSPARSIDFSPSRSIDFSPARSIDFLGACWPPRYVLSSSRLL